MSKDQIEHKMDQPTQKTTSSFKIDFDLERFNLELYETDENEEFLFIILKIFRSCAKFEQQNDGSRYTKMTVKGIELEDVSTKHNEVFRYLICPLNKATSILSNSDYESDEKEFDEFKEKIKVDESNELDLTYESFSNGFVLQQKDMCKIMLMLFR